MTTNSAPRERIGSAVIVPAGVYCFENRDNGTICQYFHDGDQCDLGLDYYPIKANNGVLKDAKCGMLK